MSKAPHIIKSLLALAVFAMGMGFSDPERETTVLVAPESEVVISGTTNVNSFSCQYNITTLELPIKMMYDEHTNRILFKNAKLQLANDCFDCGGKMINKDFKELLKTSEYPQVELQLMYVEPPKHGQKKIEVGMEIKLAGVTRHYETYLYCEDQSNICVTGTLELQLSDFGLKPPKKVLGMVKVHNEVKVNMALIMKEV
ncbi:MAG: YceI family protein [Allomuricauda sp.]